MPANGTGASPAISITFMPLRVIVIPRTLEVRRSSYQVVTKILLLLLKRFRYFLHAPKQIEVKGRYIAVMQQRGRGRGRKGGGGGGGAWNVQSSRTGW